MTDTGVIEKLAGSISYALYHAEGSGSSNPEADAAQMVLVALNLTPSQAAYLASGEGVVVPREPTPQMLDAAYEAKRCGAMKPVYRAMIAAAQPKEGDS